MNFILHTCLPGCQVWSVALVALNGRCAVAVVHCFSPPLSPSVLRLQLALYLHQHKATQRPSVLTVGQPTDSFVVNL